MAISRAGELFRRQRHEIPERTRRQVPALAPLAVGADVGIGELRFQRTKHALGGALGHGEAFDHVIEGDARMPRRHQGGEASSCSAFQNDTAMLRCSSTEERILLCGGGSTTMRAPSSTALRVTCSIGRDALVHKRRCGRGVRMARIGGSSSDAQLGRAAARR